MTANGKRRGLFAKCFSRIRRARDRAVAMSVPRNVSAKFCCSVVCARVERGVCCHVRARVTRGRLCVASRRARSLVGVTRGPLRRRRRQSAGGVLVTEDELAAAFRFFDTRNAGKITVHDLKARVCLAMCSGCGGVARGG